MLFAVRNQLREPCPAIKQGVEYFRANLPSKYDHRYFVGLTSTTLIRYRANRLQLHKFKGIYLVKNQLCRLQGQVQIVTRSQDGQKEMSVNKSFPETNTTDCSSCDQELETTFMVLNTTFGAVTLLGNVSVFLSITTRPRLRQQPMNLFIASLAITDILMAAVVVPGYSLFCVGCLEYPVSKYCWFMEGSKDIALASSIYNLLAISYDRALAVYRPLQYPVLMTRRRAIFIIIIIWGLSFCVALIRNFWNHTMTGNELSAINSKYNVILLIVVLLIPCITISVVNIKIMLTIRKQVNQVFALGNSKDPDNTISAENQTEMARKWKGTIACAVVVFVFVVSWIPRISFNIRSVITTVSPHALLQKLSIFFFIVQSSVNPFIYSFYRADIRRATLKLVSCNKL